MHRLTAWGGALALLVGLGAFARAGDPDDAPVPDIDPGLRSFCRWNGVPPEKPKPLEKRAATPVRPRPSVLKATQRAQEEANLLRRLAVIDRLQQIALDTGDDALKKQTEQLEEEARKVYAARLAAPPEAADEKPVVAATRGGGKK
jgi:hypothetical protein